MPSNYNYFHITINPKNCDGSGIHINYLTKEIIKALDDYLISLSCEYARAIENNKDLVGQHYHFVVFAKKKTNLTYLKNNLTEIISHYYNLSEASEKRLIYIKHKTKKQAQLCAGGYLAKQFVEFDNTEHYRWINNIKDEDMVEYRKEYETLVENSNSASKFSKWVLNEDKTTTSIRCINKYYEVLDILLTIDETLVEMFNSLNFQNFYIYILQTYKISYSFSKIQIFRRQIIEYLISKKLHSNLDYESLVDFLKFSKTDHFKVIEDENQYEQQTILNFWSLQ